MGILTGMAVEISQPIQMGLPSVSGSWLPLPGVPDDGQPRRGDRSTWDDGTRAEERLSSAALSATSLDLESGLMGVVWLGCQLGK